MKARSALEDDALDSHKEVNPKIRAFIDGWNQRSHHPFVWTKTPEQIFTKANRKAMSDAGH